MLYSFIFFFLFYFFPVSVFRYFVIFSAYISFRLISVYISFFLYMIYIFSLTLLFYFIFNLFPSVSNSLCSYYSYLSLLYISLSENMFWVLSRFFLFSIHSFLFCSISWRERRKRDRGEKKRKRERKKRERGDRKKKERKE